MPHPLSHQVPSVRTNTQYCVEYRVMRNGDLRTATFDHPLQRKLFILSIDTLAEVVREWEEAR